MKRTTIVLLIAFLVSAMACAEVWAQATAQISGTARDQTGAVLPGVEVTATQTDTGISRSTITNETGSYVLPNVPVGPYRLEVALPGFRTFVQIGIVLQVNSSPVINAVLEVGQVTEQVEVQANAALVETRNIGVGQVIENERILELPLNGRQVSDLIVLSGAAVQTASSSSRSPQGIPMIAVAGGQTGGSGGLSYSLDGAMFSDPYNNLSLPFPFPEAMQEFKVETGALSAQVGMHSAGSVSGVTKSGTNELHGSAFWFVRNDLFNARNYFATTNSTLKRNQFGGTVGGPIMQNKLFFFGGYQGTTLRQDPADIIGFVPTAAMLAGDLTTFASPACNAGRQIGLRAPFVNNRIDPGLYSKAALNVVAKLPKTNDPCGRFVYGAKNSEDDGQATGKIDYQWSSNHSVFGRYLVSWVDSPHPFSFTPDNLLNANGQGFDNLIQSFAFGDTYLMGPATVNAFRLTANRTAIHRVGVEYLSNSDVGINAYDYRKTVGVSVSGGFSLSANDATFRTVTGSISDELSLIQGTHQMSFGAHLAHWRANSYPVSGASGRFNFNGQETGLGMADFLTGKPNTFDQSAPNYLYVSQWYFGLYGQDTWKATPTLTLNYGLRWEPDFQIMYRDGAVYNFDYNRFQQGIKSTVFKSAPAGLYYPGDPGFPGKTGAYNHWAKFAPRIGLAWDLQGDGRMSIRAGYSLAYDVPPVETGLAISHSSPWGQETVINSPAGGLENPWQGHPGGNRFPVVFSANQPYSSYGPFHSWRYDIQPTSVSAWNLSIQRQIAAEWLASASYMGNQAVHLWVVQEQNPAIFFPGGPCTINGVTYNTCSTTANTHQRRRFSLERPQDGQYLGSVLMIDDGGTQSYHGLLLSLQRRAASGVTISGNYTWSHCIGTPKHNTGHILSPYPNPYNRDYDRGNCTNSGDRRHIFNLTAVAETPQFANATLRAMASNWRLAGIYKRSRGYLTVTSGLDRALVGTAGQRPDQILENVYGDKSLTNYLNPEAFRQPVLGTFGNTGVANILGPATWQFDIALSRIFRFGETQRLEFRAEAFNVTNSLRMGNPNTTLNSNTFGQINSASDPRIMQFALKYIF